MAWFADVVGLSPRAAARRSGLAWVGLIAVLSACSGGTSDVSGALDDASVGSDAAAADILKVPTIKASIVVTPPSGNAPLPVDVTLAVTGVDKAELFVVWDFGDGVVSNPYDLGSDEGKGGDHVQHTYVSKGNYPIQASVSWKPKPKTVFVNATTSLQVNDPASLSIEDPNSKVHVISPLVVAPGDDVTVTFALRNDGDAITQAFDTAIILSTDATIDAGDTLVDNITLPGMPSGMPNASFVDFGALNLPDAQPPVHFKVPAGLQNNTTYYVFVWTDKGNIVNEFNREDNVAYASDALTIDTTHASKPDLTISAPVFDSTKTYSPGDSLNYTQNVSNIGAGEAKQVKYAVFLSQDQKLDLDPTKAADDPSQPDTMLTALANSTLVKLAPGATLPLTYSLQLPKNTPDGNYYLIAKIDVLDKIDETDEGNNVAVTDKTVTVKLVVKQGQDLGLLDMTVQPKGTYLNGTVSVKYHVKNLGTEQSKIFPATIYFCQDKAFSEQNCLINKTQFSINPLAVGEELTASMIVTISPSTPVANIPYYYVYLRVDPANAIAELDETNNVKVFEKLVITATANVDIWPSDIGFHPSQVSAGGELKISYAIHNDGTTGSGASSTWYALSPTGVCSAAAVTNGQAILLKKVVSGGVEGLDVAQVADVVSIPAGLDHSVSDYTFCVILDGDNQLDKDKNKANNAAGSLSKVTILNPKGGCYEDPFDLAPASNNSPTTAVAVPADSTELGSCGNEDWYTIDVPKGWTLITTLDVTAPLWTTPVPADLDIDLYAPDGTTILDSQKILSMNKKASALTVPAAGKYLIRVYPHETNAKAQYVLGVSVVAPAAGIDLYAAALVVSPAATFPGGLIKVKLQAANLGATPAGDVTVHFALSSDQKPDQSDKWLSDVIVPSVAAASAFSAEQTIELPVVAGGKWYVLASLNVVLPAVETVTANNLVVSNPLQLNTQVSCAADGYSGNHTVDSAASLAPVTASYASLNVCPGLEDWFRLEIPTGTALKAKVGWTYQPGKGLVGVQIIDASKTGVLAGSANTQDTTAKVPYVQSGGTFYVHVYVLPESGGALPYDYQLDISVTEPDPTDVCLADYYEPNNSWQSGQVLGCGTATQSLCIGDEDWFHITLAANEQVILSYDNSAFQLRVFGNPNLAPLKVLGSPGSLTFTAPADGTYHIQMSYKVSGQKPKSFAYTFKVDGGNGVDLIAAIDSVFPAQIVQGEDVYLTVTLSNECKDVAGAFAYAYYFSTDATLDAGDPLLGTHEVADGLGAKTKLNRDDKAIIPLSAKPGPAYVILTADSSNTVAETQELNNNASAAIAVIPLCIADALEPNGAPEIAANLPSGKTQYLSLCPFDLDWYKVKLTAGQTLTVTMAFDATAGDLDMRLYKVAQFGQPVAVGATKGAPEKFSFTADETTTYYLRINGFNGDAAGYTLFTCIGVGFACVECADNSQCAVGQACDPTTTMCATCANDGECLDGDPCTNDLCDATLGCLHLPSAATCTDGMICTVGDTCAQGVCLSGTATDCDDANVCTNDSCDPALGCQHGFNTAKCFDGDACSTGDICAFGSCVSGSGTLNCDDANVCTTDSCSGPLGCNHVDLSGDPCSDGNACLLDEACSGGVCLSGTATPDCNDVKACTTDACDPASGCTHVALVGACDDGDPCTAVDSCVGTACVGALKLFCDDGNPCTADACAGLLGCTHTGLTGGPCNDGLFCTGLDLCASGTCVGAADGKCEDGNVCTGDTCSETTGCGHSNLVGTACTDGNACTEGDACQGGLCTPTGVKTCVDSNACTVDGCDPATGCTFPAKVCNDGNPCTTDSCDPGIGCGIVNLPDNTTCTTGTCQVGICTP